MFWGLVLSVWVQGFVLRGLGWSGVVAVCLGFIGDWGTSEPRFLVLIMGVGLSHVAASMFFLLFRFTLGP